MPKHMRPPGRQLRSVALRYRQQGDGQLSGSPAGCSGSWDDRKWPPPAMRGSIAWPPAGEQQTGDLGRVHHPAGNLPGGATSRRDGRTAKLEAVLFLAGEPLTSRKLGQLAGLADGTEARTLIRQLNVLYQRRGSSFRVEEVAGGFQLLTRPKFAGWLRRLHQSPPATRLSGPAMETLAVVAYRQPVLRAEIEAVRGVQCGEMLRQLMERDFVRIVGKSDELGRPFLYATTRRFLQTFGLRHLDELPQAQLLRGVGAVPTIILSGAADPQNEPQPGAGRDARIVELNRDPHEESQVTIRAIDELAPAEHEERNRKPGVAMLDERAYAKEEDDDLDEEEDEDDDLDDDDDDEEEDDDDEEDEEEEDELEDDEWEEVDDDDDDWDDDEEDDDDEDDEDDDWDDDEEDDDEEEEEEWQEGEEKE